MHYVDQGKLFSDTTCKILNSGLCNDSLQKKRFFSAQKKFCRSGDKQKPPVSRGGGLGWVGGDTRGMILLDLTTTRADPRQPGPGLALSAILD